ncbi:MAG: TM2 domain-containing protein [Mycoplasmataceae bacterium]|jgi:TM2 domain-containing membrane protein YozV|nr:TM2 domain-containing protein [Mycoplasmataceae bacterium]
MTNKKTKINKILFIVIGAWLLGFIGADRFMRGQIGLGIVKLLLGWLTFGIWYLIDLIIAITKVGSYPGPDFEFENGRWTK